MKIIGQTIMIPDKTMKTWQEIVDIIAAIIGIPACLIMMLKDPEIEVLVSSKSRENPYKPGEKEIFNDSGLYCETVIKTNKKLLVPDALSDDKWKDNPDVKNNMISYMGFPIKYPDGKPFGTICVLDNKANSYSKIFEKLVSKFRDLIENDIEILYMNHMLGKNNKKLTDYLMELQNLKGMVAICSNCKKIRDEKGEWRSIEHYFFRHPKAKFSHCICPDCKKKLYPDVND